MNHDGPKACVSQVNHVFGERTLEGVIHHGVAAELDDDDSAREALQPGQGFDQYGGLGRGIQLTELRGHELYALFSWT
jgi:hypothetical protein